MACAAHHRAGGGSHYKIAHDALPDMLSVPFARPVKAVQNAFLKRFAAIETIRAKA